MFYLEAGYKPTILYIFRTSSIAGDIHQPPKYILYIFRTSSTCGSSSTSYYKSFTYNGNNVIISSNVRIYIKWSTAVISSRASGLERENIGKRLLLCMYKAKSIVQGRFLTQVYLHLFFLFVKTNGTFFSGKILRLNNGNICKNSMKKNSCKQLPFCLYFMHL